MRHQQSSKMLEEYQKKQREKELFDASQKIERLDLARLET